MLLSACRSDRLFRATSSEKSRPREPIEWLGSTRRAFASQRVSHAKSNENHRENRSKIDLWRGPGAPKIDSNSHPNRSSGSRKSTPRGTKIDFGGSKIEPRSPRGGSRSTQERSRAPQERPKSAPRAPKSGPRAPKSPPERPGAVQKSIQEAQNSIL